MARKAREISESGIYFVVLKGSELYRTDADKEKFAQVADDKFEGGKVYSIDFRGTEIRMVVKEGIKGISAEMKSLSTVYARYFNNAAGRSGKVFEGRFHSEPLDTPADTPRYGGSDVKKAELRKAEDRRRDKTVKEVKADAENETKAPEVREKSKAKKNLPSWLL